MVDTRTQHDLTNPLDFRNYDTVVCYLWGPSGMHHASIKNREGYLGTPGMYRGHKDMKRVC